MERNELIVALTTWIDPEVIANAIVDQMDEEEIEYTLDNGQQIWLNHLERIHGLL